MTTVLLFARAAELAGIRTLEIHAGDAEEVVASLDIRFGPEFARVSRSSSIAVDGEVVSRDDLIGQQATELAILPPVSGGCIERQR